MTMITDGFANQLVGDLSVDVGTHNLSLCEYEGCTNISAINYDDAGFVQSDFGFLMPATIDDGSRNMALRMYSRKFSKL